MQRPLIVIPSFANRADHLQVLEVCLKTIRTTADADILIVDDCSELPAAKVVLPKLAEKYGAELVIQEENGGFSRAVNVGMRRAHEERRAVVLCNQDIQFVSVGWLAHAMLDPAPVVGARLLFPSMLIQHGGVYFSVLHQYFDHTFRLAPFNLPEANVRSICPVTAALMIIKPEAMDAVGYYDEAFRLNLEDIEYCLRVFEAGLECAYNPNVVAIHHEGLVRQKSSSPKMQQWMSESTELFAKKVSHMNLNRYVHPIAPKTDLGKMAADTLAQMDAASPSSERVDDVDLGHDESDPN